MQGRFNLSEWAINHRGLVYYIMVMVLIAGTMSYIRLGRNEDPIFTIKTMVLQAKWPGANIDDTINQLTERLEKKLQEVPNIDYVRSFTSPGSSTVYVNLKGSTSAKDVPDIWYQVRKKMADIAPTLPQGVVGPFFNDEFGDTYGIIYAFQSDGFSNRQLLDYVETARNKLLQVPNVSKIEIIGKQDECIYIEFSVHKLAGLGINPKDLIQILKSQNSISPAGILQTNNEVIILQVSGKFLSEKDLQATSINIDNKLLRLEDIATIRRGNIDPPEYLFRFNDKPAIGLAISMVAGGDILKLGKDINQAMQEIIQTLPWGIDYHCVANQPDVVKQNISEFIKALEEAFLIVLFVSFLSLGIRAGAVVACSIPLVLTITFIIMDYYYIDLQRISLGALIISLGLLVDDAMITTEMMILKLEEGWNKISAATYAYTSTAIPMLTGTLVTIAAFIPIGFAKSSAGEYVFSLFSVIAISLIISWFVAVIFTPLIGVILLPDKLKPHNTENSKLMKWFYNILITAITYPKKTIAVTVVLFILSIIGLPLIPNQFFPSSDRPELLVNVQLPQNSSIFATDREVKKLEELLTNNKDIDYWSSYIGRGAIRFYLPMDAIQGNKSLAQLVIVTKDIEARKRVQDDLENIFKESFYNLNTRVMPLEMGPPIGWPIQYRVSGENIETVRDIAYQLAKIISTEQQVGNINFDWIEPARAMYINIDQNQAKLLGISSEDLSMTLNRIVSGSNVTQIPDSIYLINVIMQSIAEEKASPSLLESLQIPNMSGQNIPITQFSSIEYKQEYPIIWRRDRLSTITVQANVADGVLPATIVKNLRSKIADFNLKLPTGYKIAIGGTTEESSKSQSAVMASVPIMMLIITTLLMIQLQNIQRVLLVLSVVPLGLIGVVGILLLTDKPLGFVAMLGIIALIGMIVRNSVIIVTQIESEIEHGLSPWDAIIAATMHRFRPVILTAMAAILGMIPIAPTIFWGPMAYAIMGGLAVATALTLIFLPALYCVWFKIVPNKTV